MRRPFTVPICVLLAVFLALPVLAAPNEPAGSRIDLNSAGMDELQEIPGIGPALARRILDFRKEHGPFRRVEDLLKVRGIGEKSLAKMRPHVTVSDDG